MFAEGQTADGVLGGQQRLQGLLGGWHLLVGLGVDPGQRGGKGQLVLWISGEVR